MHLTNIYMCAYICIYRVESFIEHQDACTLGRLRSESQALQPAACLSRTASSPSPSSTETNLAMPINTTTSNNPSDTTTTTTTTPTPALVILSSTSPSPQNPILSKTSTSTSTNPRFHNLDLQLSTTTTTIMSNPILDENQPSPKANNHHENQYSTQLQLSIGSSDFGEKNESNNHKSSPRESMMSSTTTMANNCNLDKTRALKEEARKQLRVAMAEKSYAEEARQQAKRQLELAELEFANAKRIRQQAQQELDKAQALKEHAIKQLNSTLLQLTCHACKHHFHARTLSYIITTSSDCQTLENDNRTVLPIRDRLGKSAIHPS